jgi:hypothetical protein
MTVEPQVDHLPAHRLWQPVTVKWLLFVLGAALAYAVLRYHIAGDVPWRHLPPISLLAVVIATIPLMLKVAAIRRKVSKETEE